MMSSLITTSKWEQGGGQQRHPHPNNIIEVVAIKIQNYQSHDIQWKSIPKMVSEKIECSHNLTNIKELFFIGEFPWMVAVLTTRGNKFEYRCGGSVIHPSVIMTAAHCVDAINGDHLKVRAGEWDTRNTNEPWPHQDRAVAEIIKHGDYYKHSVHNDIALLRLDKPLRLAPNVNTVCLPMQEARLEGGQRCVVSGWGKDMFGRKGQYQPILKKIELPIVEHGKCQRLLRQTKLGRYFRLHRSFICAGGERDNDACKGDGGSPLVCATTNTSPTSRYYQAGIVSWGVGCREPKVPAAYVNVAAFRHWIDRQMEVRKLDTHFYRN